MHFNYNGIVNRPVLLALKEICETAERAKKAMTIELEQSGKVWFYTDDYTANETSKIITISSEEENQTYYNGWLQRQINCHLERTNHSTDHLLSVIAEFIMQKFRHPDEQEMRNLEIIAEARRLSTVPVEPTLYERQIEPSDKIVAEILLLAEAIMEQARQKTPEDIVIDDDNEFEILFLGSERLHLRISRRLFLSNGDYRDYYMKATRHCYGWQRYPATAIHWNGSKPAYCDSTPGPCVHGDLPIDLGTIHRTIVNLAESMGIEFISEVTEADLETLVV